MAPTLCDAHRLVSTYGVTIASLQLYEDRGLLWPIIVGATRYYTPRDRVRLEIILKGKRLGFSLTEIEKLVFESAAVPPAALPDAGLPADIAEPRKPDVDRVLDELRTLIGQREGLDLSIDALRARLNGK